MSQRFIVTKEHRRFTEFADAVRRGHTIGLCFGSAGVGKTLSARRYAHYEKAHDLLTYWGPRSDNDAKIYAALNRSRTVLYTPSVLTTPRTLKDELTQAITRTNMCIEQHLVPPGTATPEAWGWRHGRNYVELIIVDEAERLRPAALELLRDRYDRDDIALILIGMPGLEKQFSHYPQFYSRVGFAHQYRPLGQDELLFVLERHWRSLGKTLDPDDFTDAQAIAAIARITRGNFRLLERLFPQIQRVLKINELDALADVQDEVVLVGHSVGGLTVPLVATMRPVRTMVFVAAGVPSPGRSHWDQSQDGRLRVGGVYERALVDDQGRNLLPPDVAADVLYHECPPEVAQWAASQLRWQAQKIVREPTPLDEWPNVPSRYVVCRRDRIVRTEWQLAEASVRVGDRSPVELDSDHSPMLSRPRELAAVLADIARDLEVVSASA